MSINLKTELNDKNQNEIVMISGVLHTDGTRLSEKREREGEREY
jgi:hypothetical protein